MAFGCAIWPIGGGRTTVDVRSPTRRRIVEALRAGERQAGFVRVRPDGQRRMYSLQPEPFRELDEWLAAKMATAGFTSQLTKLDARFSR